MKKKIFMLLLAVMMLSIAGCGKKGNTLAETLINENPDEIKGERINITTSETDSDTDSIFTNLSEGQSSISEDVSQISISEDVVQESISGDVAQESTSENEAYEYTYSDANEGADMGSDINPGSEEADYGIVQNDKMLVCNLCGLDIDKLYVSTSTGSLQNTEILGFDDLYDGQSFEYRLSDIDELKKAGIIKLSVSITARNKQVIEFGEVEVIDPTNIKLILTFDSDNGYFMYLE